ncbi:MAG: lyase family protein [Candidatus Bathyarchaeia archaeon]
MAEKKVSVYSLFSPTDFRYSVKDLEPYLSEEAYIRYKAKVEAALAEQLASKGICSQEVANEIHRASEEVTAAEVYAEEKRIRHDVRALVNMIRQRVSDSAKPFVHLTATSYDIVDTANALRYKDAVMKVILPDMAKLEIALISLAEKEKATLQIGRTHGQHAEPITFGFAVAQYVARWGSRILTVKECSERLVGKFSGAVGSYNALSLFFEEPEAFESDLLASLGLKPSEISTQIVPPEPIVDLFHSIVSAFGVLANFSRDMRNLQRSEIGEVGEPFEDEQVGSSTMPQKRNPMNFENVESAWKRVMPQMVTLYLDQVSEHQRDLTNSLSQRYLPELLVIFDSSIRRLTKVVTNLRVDGKNMCRNFESGKDKAIAEPLYILLSYYGHPDAHEYVRRLTEKSYITGIPLHVLALEDPELKCYFDKFTPTQISILQNPEKYVGIAVSKTERVADTWKNRLRTMGFL